MALYQDAFTVPASAIDENGHANNVAFVQWMQDVAIRHFDAAGGRAAMQAAGGAWVVRSHHVEYLRS
jgi:acyl-CoA thioester hydrolase